jgi:hypothetical protein
MAVGVVVLELLQAVLVGQVLAVLEAPAVQEVMRLMRILAAVVVVALIQVLGPAALEAPALLSSKSINNMTTKTYRFLGIDTAMHLLRPGAKWEISNNVFTRWDDPRPCPSIEEVYWVMDKIKEFEEMIPTIWLPEQLEEMGIRQKEIEDAIA